MLALLAALLAGCGGDGDGGGPPGPPPRPPDRGQGLEATNEQEVEALLRDVRNVRARCSGGTPVPGQVGTSRFECAGGGKQFRVEWRHYGDGRYTIAEDGRVVERGALSITE